VEDDDGAVARRASRAIPHDPGHCLRFAGLQGGIFEGLLIAMTVHGLINFVVFTQANKVPSKIIKKKYWINFHRAGAVRTLQSRQEQLLIESYAVLSHGVAVCVPYVYWNGDCSYALASGGSPQRLKAECSSLVIR
jgi:hypothetical protein